MGEACSKCFHNLQGIEETAFKPGRPKKQKNTQNDGHVELISVRSSGEKVVVAENFAGWREDSIAEAVAADCREHNTTKVEKESDAEVEIRVEDVNIDIETDKSGTIFDLSDAGSDECIAGLTSPPDKSDGELLLKTEIRDTESEDIVNEIVVQSEAEITAAPNFSTYSLEQTNLLNANNTDNKIDSVGLNTNIALYNYYSISILKDALLTLKGNICVERTIKDSKNRSEHLKSPKKLSRVESVMKKSMIQEIEDFAAKVGEEILHECIAESGKLTAIGQGTQSGPKYETSSNVTQSKSVSHSLGCAAVDVGVSEKCLLDSDSMKFIPSCKTVRRNISSSGDAGFEMLPQRSIPDSQLECPDEMENIAYLVVTSVIKDAMSKYLKTSQEITKSAHNTSEHLTGSVCFEKEGPSTQEAKKLDAIAQGEGAAGTGSTEPTDNEEVKHGNRSEAENPRCFQCGESTCVVEHTKTSHVEVRAGLMSIPGNNDVVLPSDNEMSRNEGTMSRNEATLLGTNKHIVTDEEFDQKNTIVMLTQESPFSSFLDRVAGDAILQGVTVATVQIQQSSSCHQQKFDIKANKEGIATEEKLLNEGRSTSFEVVVKQTEQLEVLGWFAERLISQLLEY